MCYLDPIVQYISPIIDDKYIIIDTTSIRLFHFNEILENVPKYFFDLSQELNNDGLYGIVNMNFKNCPISEFINNNKEIFDEIDNIIHRKFLVRRMESHRYVEGWYHSDEDGNIFSVDNNKISAFSHEGYIYSDYVYKLNFSTVFQYGCSVFVDEHLHKNEDINKIYNLLLINESDKVLCNHYADKFTNNNREVYETLTKKLV